jgi:hypothetical protein
MVKADDSAKLEHARSLLAELKAIEFWDATSWCRQHEWWDTISSLNRSKRRIKILCELRTLLVNPDNDEPR